MNSDLKITSEIKQAGVDVTVFRIRGWLDAQSEEQLLQEEGTLMRTGRVFY